MSVEIYATLGDPHEIAANLSDLRYLVFQGMKGDKGDPGFSPEITSSAIPGGHRIDITNELGPDSFNVMDGEDGADGVSPTVQTEAITGGHRVTITDKAHPHGQSFDVMDGEDEGAVRFDETQTLTDEQKNTACRNIGALGQLEYDAIQQSLSALDADISLKADEADIPTKVSDLQNDTGFVTAQQAATAAPVQSVNGRTGAVTVNEVPDASGASVGQVLSKTANGLGWTTPSGGGGAASLIINLYYHSSTDSYTTSASPTQLYNALPNCALAAAEHTIPVTDYKKDGANYVTAVFVDPAYENEKLSAIVWTLTAATSSSTVTVTREEVAVDGVPDSTSATVGQVLTKTQYGTSWAENIPQSAASLRLMYDGLFAPSDPDLYLTSNLGIETAEGIQNALHYGTIGSAEFVDVSTSTDHVVYDLYRSSVENGVAIVVFTHEEADCIRTVTMTGNTKSVPTFGTIPLTGGTSANAVLYTPQSLTDAQKAQARTNVGAGTYSKPSGGIPASDLAQAVQDALDATSSGLTEDVKQALLDCFEHVAWIDADGQDYYGALYDALYPPASTVSVTNTLSGCTTSNAATSVAEQSAYTAIIAASSGYTLTGAAVSITMGGTDITSTAYSNGTIFIASVTGALVITVAAVAVALSGISAVYTQSGTVYDTDTLDSLKADLVVTATYSDSTTASVAANDYTLSGTLTEGTSTITVSYGGKTATFNVTVSHVSTTEYALHQDAGYTGQINFGLSPQDDGVAKLEVTLDLPTYTGSSNKVLFNSPGWIGFNNTDWKYNNSTTTPPKKVNRALSAVMGQGKQTVVFDGWPIVGSWQKVIIGYGTASYNPEVTWYEIKMYDSNDVIIADWKPTTNTGEFYDSIGNRTVTASVTTGLEVIEVTT